MKSEIVGDNRYRSIDPIDLMIKGSNNKFCSLQLATYPASFLSLDGLVCWEAIQFNSIDQDDDKNERENERTSEREDERVR